MNKIEIFLKVDHLAFPSLLADFPLFEAPMKLHRRIFNVSLCQSFNELGLVDIARTILAQTSVLLKTFDSKVKIETGLLPYFFLKLALTRLDVLASSVFIFSCAHDLSNIYTIKSYLECLFLKKYLQGNVILICTIKSRGTFSYFFNFVLYLAFTFKSCVFSSVLFNNWVCCFFLLSLPFSSSTKMLTSG